MDIQKEIELFEELLLANPDFDESLLAKDEDSNYENCEISDQLGIFQAGIEVAEREARMSAKAQAQAVPEWISAEDRMPEEGEEVWVHHYGHIVQATKDKKYSGGFKQRNCRGWESVSCYISHWMSMSIKLPESYNFYYEHDAKVAQEKAIIEAQEQSHDSESFK